MSEPTRAVPLETGYQVRLAARAKALKTQTSGLAPSYLQANLIVLPSRYADDFRLLCSRNPVPCPLLAESSVPGSFSELTTHLLAIGPSGTKLDVARDVDLRHDFPRYRTYKDGAVMEEKEDIAAEWSPEHVGFLIGCSYSFEEALAKAGLPPRQILHGRNVAMYRTTLPLCPAGVFTGSTYVVSMRPYSTSDVGRVREVTRSFVATHGEPIAWGWEAVHALGIQDITQPEWGQAQLKLDGSGQFDESDEGYVPVFWGCGVTPQNAVMTAALDGLVMAHAPGHMLVLDLKDDEVFSRPSKSLN